MLARFNSRFRLRSPLPASPSFPLSSKLSFASGGTISNDPRASRLDREQRTVGVQGSRSRDTASIRSLKPLVVRPVLRFRSTIKLISAFYSIGMYKGGWTDYFLVPALDCRESRTHFFLRTRARTPVHAHRCLLCCSPPPLYLLRVKETKSEGHVVVHRCTHDDVTRQPRQKVARGGEKKSTEQFIAHDSGLLPVCPSV